MSGPSSNTTQRLIRELKDYSKSPNEALLHLGPVDDEDLLRWEAVLKGVNGTPYEGELPGTTPRSALPALKQFTATFHPYPFLPLPLRPKLAPLLSTLTCTNNTPDGLWHLRIAIPPNYPLSPPTIHFTTRISHPNISFSTGEICLTLLTTEHWSPVYTLSTTLTAIQQLLTDPQPDSPLNVDVAALLRDGDLAGWESVVRYWTGEERWKGAGNLGR
jgi:peroxin-4